MSYAPVPFMRDHATNTVIEFSKPQTSSRNGWPLIISLSIVTSYLAAIVLY